MDNKEFPRGVEVVVGAYIINDKNEVLLTRSPKWKTLWIIGGGHVEPGETLENAVKRETFEELGVEIEVIKQFIVGEMIATPPEFKRNAHFIYIDFLTKLKTTDFKFNEETSEIKWFKIDDAINDETVRDGVRKGLIKLKEML